MTESKLAAAVCPLCGGDNQCAIAAGQPKESCWCQRVTLSAEAKAKAMASDSAGKRCLCQACGQPTGVTRGER